MMNISCKFLSLNFIAIELSSASLKLARILIEEAFTLIRSLT